MKGEQDVGGISVLLTTAFWCFQPVSVLFAQYSLLESLCIKRKIITLLREYTAVSVLFSQKINCILFFFFWLVTSAILFMLPGLISWIKASIMRLIFASFLLPSARSFSLVQRTFFVCLFFTMTRAASAMGIRSQAQGMLNIWQSVEQFPHTQKELPCPKW